MTLLREVTSEKGTPILASINNEMGGNECPHCGKVAQTCKRGCNCKCAMMDGKVEQDQTKELLFG